jgi:hypothetical protein
MAGLNGSLAHGNDNDYSDIDFLIIAKPNRLYTARFFSHAIIQLTGWRRYGKKAIDRICLNCYLSTNHLDITPKNPDSQFKVAQSNKYLIVFVDEDKIADRFFAANQWFSHHATTGKDANHKVAKQLLHGRPPRRPYHILEHTLGGKFGDWFEQKMMVWQQRRIERGIHNGDETLATLDEIRLHPHKFNRP